MKRVLIAEDEAAIREFVVINLRRGGYEVVEAQDAPRRSSSMTPAAAISTLPCSML